MAKRSRTITTPRGQHRLSKTPEYSVWVGMIHRCYNPKRNSYPGYGGRGIRVCDRWRESFEAFLADMGPRPSPAHTIDRIDNSGNYEPGNCRWAGIKTQNRNTRVNRVLEFRGESRCLTEWAEIFGLPDATVQYRLDVMGWDVERALTAPNDARGANRHNAKLDDDAVREIRRLLAEGHRSKDIADRFGVNKSLICMIRYGRAWTHVV